MKILVSSITESPWCITAEDAEIVYEHIIGCLTVDDVVELDFVGTTGWSAPFFSVAVGTLTRDFSESELQRRLQVINLPVDIEEILRRVLRCSREYFHDPRIRAYVDEQHMED